MRAKVGASPAGLQNGHVACLAPPNTVRFVHRIIGCVVDTDSKVAFLLLSCCDVRLMLFIVIACLISRLGDNNLT